jgi:hypothetical protein
MSRKKEFAVHMDSQTFLIREGESRRVQIPMMMTMKNGILIIGYPGAFLDNPSNYYEEAPAKPAKRLERIPRDTNLDGAPAPTFEELNSGREYEQGKGG